MKLFNKKTNEYKENVEEKKIKRIINIIFSILVIIMIMITIDVISVSKYDKGPFFALRTKVYKDGGTKEYLGIGYKVIKYNQIQGRKDKEIGSWKLKYNIEPINISSLDLAIEFINDYKKAYKNYGKKFIKTSATITEISKEKNTITIKYDDPDNKYDLEIICNMAKKESINDFSKNDEITIIGTITNFKIKTKNNTNRLYIDNVFAEK